MDLTRHGCSVFLLFPVTLIHGMATVEIMHFSSISHKWLSIFQVYSQEDYLIEKKKKVISLYIIHFSHKESEIYQKYTSQNMVKSSQPSTILAVGLPEITQTFFRSRLC